MNAPNNRLSDSKNFMEIFDKYRTSLGVGS